MSALRNPNRKPTHPGEVLSEDVLPELAWTQAEFAARLMVSLQTVSDLLHEKKAVTAEMAIRIARAVGGTPESWLASYAGGFGSLDSRNQIQKQSFFCTQSSGSMKEKKPLQVLARAFCLAPRPGLEPGTYGLTVRRSTD